MTSEQTSAATSGGTGHRALPHTADLIIEAWAPTRIACLAEVVRALVDTIADVSAVGATATWPVQIAGDDDVELVVALLEEVLFVIDAHDLVPVGARLTATADDGLTGHFDVVARSQLDVTGPAPKGIAGCRVVGDARGWVCRATIDV